MSFDGEAFVQDMRAELFASGRTLDKADWVERVRPEKPHRRSSSGGPASTTGVSRTTPAGSSPSGWRGCRTR